MTRWGVGPAITKYFATLTIVGIGARIALPETFAFACLTDTSRLIAGASLFVLGVALYLWALACVHPAFTAGELCTRGAYGVCRHPVYGSWALLITPGLALLVNSWLLMAAVAPMYVLLRLYVVREERWLEERFGEAFCAYRRRVPAVLPVGWISRLFIR
jgi:protein-S-isoprenylcysteine O-methyltransferase Ste14